MKRIGAGVATLLLFSMGGILAQEQERSSGRKEHPNQASVAVKKEFDRIADVTDAVKKALEANDLEEAKKREGKEASFRGRVVKVFKSQGNSVTILNFAKNYKQAVVGVVRPAEYSKFPNLETLLDKPVLITGKVVLFEGRPQVNLTAFSQIKIITGKTKE